MVVQKFMKGLIVSRLHRHRYYKRKLEKELEFLHTYTMTKQVAAQILISKWWKVKVKRVRYIRESEVIRKRFEE